MARIFAAEQPTIPDQHFQYMAVTHRRPRKGNTKFADRVFKREIAHQSTDNSGHGALFQPPRDDGIQQLVTIVEMPCGIDHLDPVAVTVECNAEILSLIHI